uniref:G protein-coupled receptor n=1 Tax=Steinernema glaseri TaxID=37863 RepID=A0A1I7YUF0_9BILA
MVLSPAVVYTNYGIQFACALVIASLNPLILLSRWNRSKANSQLTMILIHIGLHFVFAVSTLMYAGAVLLFFKDDRKHSIIFWTVLIYGSILSTTALSDLFLALDRYIAITYPIQYLVSMKSKLVLYSTFFTIAFCLSIAPACALHRVEEKPQALMLADFVGEPTIRIILISGMVLMILNVVVSAFFLMELRKFNKTLLGIRQSTKVANTTVAYQMVLAGIFWVVPAVSRTVMENCFDLYIRKTLGPLTVTLVVVYMACCSVLYWTKLVPEKTSPFRTISTSR